jgi:hypothetical protein
LLRFLFTIHKDFSYNIALASDLISS